MKNGFTLIEAVIAIAVVAGLMFVVSSMLISVFSGSKQQYTALGNVDNARIIAHRFVNEIRSAAPGVDGSAAISVANDSEIIFHSPDKSTGLISRIRYYVAGDELYKGVVAPTGSPLSYNLAEESISLVQQDLTLSGNPLFYYYDGDYWGSGSPLSQPVNIPSIRFVRINLTVLRQTQQASDSVFVLNTGAAVRSLKNNLGD